MFVIYLRLLSAAPGRLNAFSARPESSRRGRQNGTCGVAAGRRRGRAPGRGSGPTGGRAGPRRGDRRAGMTAPFRRPGRGVPWARVFGRGVRRGGGEGGACVRGRGDILPPRRNVCPEPLPCKGCSVADAVVAPRNAPPESATAQRPPAPSPPMLQEVRHAATLPQRRSPCGAWTWRRCGSFCGAGRCGRQRVPSGLRVRTPNRADTKRATG